MYQNIRIFANQSLNVSQSGITAVLDGLTVTWELQRTPRNCPLQFMNIDAVPPQTGQIRLRTEMLAKIKEENRAVATEIAAERRAKKKLSQHRVSPSIRATLEWSNRNRPLGFLIKPGGYDGCPFSSHWCARKLSRGST